MGEKVGTIVAHVRSGGSARVRAQPRPVVKLGLEDEGIDHAKCVILGLIALAQGDRLQAMPD
jgi:hypothetical protein